jgi:hypothetical protein
MIGKLFEGLAEAVGDIRHKLVEEGWFGRPVTDKQPEAGTAIPGWDMQRPSFEEQWAVGEREAAHDAPSPEHQGLDR